MKRNIDRHNTVSSRFRSLAILAFAAALGAMPATGQGGCLRLRLEAGPDKLL